MHVFIIHAGVVNQFDTMVFPEVKDKFAMIFKRTTNYVLEWLGYGSGSDHPKFTVPHPEDMRSICMKIYLEPYKNEMMSGVFEKGFNVFFSVKGFNTLYRCCLTQCCGKETYAVDKWKIPRVSNVSILNCTIRSTDVISNIHWISGKNT